MFNRKLERLAKFLDMQGVRAADVQVPLQSDSSEHEDLCFIPRLKKRCRTDVDDATEYESESEVRQDSDKLTQEYLTIQELAGRLPSSLLTKVDLMTFLSANNL